MLDHTKKKKSVVKDRKEWDKIIVNIPKELLKEFDIASQTRYYSRSEAIKEAMRTFIQDSMQKIKHTQLMI